LLKDDEVYDNAVKLALPLSPTKRCAGGATSPIPSDEAFSWSAVRRDVLLRLPVVGVVGRDDVDVFRGTDEADEVKTVDGDPVDDDADAAVGADEAAANTEEN